MPKVKRGRLARAPKDEEVIPFSDVQSMRASAREVVELLATIADSTGFKLDEIWDTYCDICQHVARNYYKDDLIWNY